MPASWPLRPGRPAEVRPLKPLELRKLDALNTRRRQIVEMLSTEQNRLVSAPSGSADIETHRILKKRVAAINRDLNKLSAKASVAREDKISPARRFAQAPGFRHRASGKRQISCPGAGVRNPETLFPLHLDT